MRITCTIGIIHDSKINIQATIQLMPLKVMTYNLRTGSYRLKRTVIQQATFFVPICNTVKTVLACVYAKRVRQETLQKYSGHLPSCHQTEY